MIIQKIYIDGFGHFHQFTLENLQPGINLITGENEAGKSTLLNFIRFTLLGYPSRTSERCEPLNGGKHGGRMELLNRQGDNVILERFAGSKGGPVSIRINDIITGTEADWDLITNHATRDLYNNIYGISLYELSSESSIQQAGITDKILSMGIGLGSVSVKDVTNAIQDTIDVIYKLSGKTQQIPLQLRKIDQLQRNLQEHRSHLPKYEKVCVDLDRLSTSIEEAVQQEAIYKREKGWLENCEKAFPFVIQIGQIDRELESLPQTFDCPQNSGAVFAELISRRKQTQERLRLIYQNATNDGIDQLEEQIRSFQPDETLLSNEMLINELRNDLSRYETEFSAYETTLIEIEQDRQNILHSIQDLHKDWTWDTLENFQGIEEKKLQAMAFQKEYQLLQEEWLRCDARLQERIQPSRWNQLQPVNLIVLIFLVLAVPLFFYAWPFSIALVLIAMGLLIFRKNMERSTEDPLLVQQAALIERKQKLTERFQNFLQDHLDLSDDLSPDNVLIILGSISQLRSDLQRWKLLNDRNKFERLSFLSAYRSQLEILPYENFHHHSDKPRYLVEYMSAALETAREEKRRKNTLKEKLALREAEADHLHMELNSIGQELLVFLNQCGCTSEQAFEEKFDLESKARDLLVKLKNQLDKLEIVVGPGRMDDLFNECAQKDSTEVMLEISRLDHSILTLLEETNRQRIEMGEYKKEQEWLVGSSSLSRLTTELETERQVLKNAWLNWLSGKLALHVFNQVKHRYEKEQQPQVIQQAGYYFKEVTGGKYIRIQLSMDDKTVWAINQHEQAKSIEQLSRGTKEQLLICLRLALIAEYEKNSEPLPIVLDDVLVNGDPHRIRALVGLLETFSEGRQIILFTCHPFLNEYFSDKVNRLNF